MTYLALELVDELVSPALGISVHSLPLLLFRLQDYKLGCMGLAVVCLMHCDLHCILDPNYTFLPFWVGPFHAKMLPG